MAKLVGALEQSKSYEIKIECLVQMNNKLLYINVIFAQLRIKRADGQAIKCNPPIHSDAIKVLLRPHLEGYVQNGLPRPLLSNPSQIESCADSGAEGCVIPTSTFRQLGLPVFDVDEDEDIVGGAGHESYDVIGGCYLTIEHPNHNQPTCYKTSNQFFWVCIYCSDKTLCVFRSPTMPFTLFSGLMP